MTTALDPRETVTRQIRVPLTNSTGRHTAADEARPSGYVGRHRVADGQLSTAQQIAVAQQQRADAGLALIEAVA